MITFLIGIFILIIGYFVYSKYIEKIFDPKDELTPASKLNDGVDFVPLEKNKNMLIHLLNIAGLGPILGAIQGILFGPIAFILIPLGCIFMGGVHDYFSGMISLKNNGAQITELIKKYLGKKYFYFFIIVVSIMLLLLTSVFVYTSGDLLAQKLFHQENFLLSNPIVISIYLLIAFYYIMASLFPIDKIIGKFYPFFGFLLLFGTFLVLVGFFTKGVNLADINFLNINEHPDKLPILPVFFMTVSCGLLSGFHSTQSTIISRTLKSEKDGKKVFYGMMCVESLIAMIWAAGAMHVYSMNLVSENLIGTANVVNNITDAFVPLYLTFVVTFAVVILPITSGDTALRGLRMILGEAFNLKQGIIKNRLIIMIPIVFVMFMVIVWAKSNQGSFSLIWRYFNFVNQLIAIPTFLYATIYIKNNNKNFLVALIPAIFYIFITVSFILNSKIGFNLPYKISEISAIIFSIGFLIYFVLKKLK